ncbi:MAG: hypothetical protein K1X64_14995 [Myxococcaceae bacterium]|nr:hypothetical protein [Myxococcaceae bacterium]
MKSPSSADVNWRVVKKRDETNILEALRTLAGFGWRGPFFLMTLALAFGAAMLMVFWLAQNMPGPHGAGIGYEPGTPNVVREIIFLICGFGAFAGIMGLGTLTLKVIDELTAWWASQS